MLVDDENLALMQLGKLLQEIPDIEVIGSYMDSSLAIDEVSRLQPDVVFLDIHMPGIYGLQAAELIQETYPAVKIVFVTAFDEYAVQAFDLYALDYVLKPIRRDRLTRTVERLKMSILNNPEVQEVAPHSILLKCLHTMQIEMSGHEPVILKWRTAKAQELFAYMLHHRGQLVRKDVLFELLWPDYDIPKATTHLYTTIYQVRQALKRIGVDIHIHSLSMKEGYVLDAARVRLDTEEWEQALKQLDGVTSDNIHAYQRLLEMYSGDYLSDCDYLWAEHERQRLRKLWIQHAYLLGEYYLEQEFLNESMMVYLRVQQQDPYEETCYLELMRVYDQLEDKAAVEEQYERLVLVLNELDVTPSQKTIAWYDNWKLSSYA